MKRKTSCYLHNIAFQFSFTKRFIKNDLNNSDKSDANSDLNLTKDANNSLCNVSFSKPVLFDAVRSPYLPFPTKFIDMSMNVHKDTGYFATKDKYEKGNITSIDQINRVGSLIKAKEIKGLEFMGFKCIETSFPRIVEALHLEDGSVYIREYGEKEINTLKVKDMPQASRLLFLAILNETKRFQDNSNKKLSQISNFNVETIQQLRSYLAELIPFTSSELQKIIEKKTVKESLEIIEKFIIRKSVEKNIEIEVLERFKNKWERIRKMELLEIKKDIVKEKMEENDEEEIEENTLKTRAKLAMKNMPKHTKEIFSKELNRYSRMAENDAEKSKMEVYIDWVSSLPWGIETPESTDIEMAQKILDKSHYGLKDVKSRIMEMIAIRMLKKQNSKGKILCFVGPPGSGKTSIVKAIARALHKNFVQLFVGGMSDVNEIKGHRRTYVSALPGQITCHLKKAKSINPVFLLDEIDKIDKAGVASSLLSILDPSQNNKFCDDYIELEQDLSKVLFICTANHAEYIHPTLQNRMEIVDIAAYTQKEKCKIASDFIFPRTLKESGLTEKQCSISPEAIESIVNWYCREPGVRELDRKIQRILRKIAKRVVSGEKSVAVTASNIEAFLGTKPYSNKRMFGRMIPGISIGLSVSELTGGSLGNIETSIIGSVKSEEPVFKTTGSLSQVIQESISLAYAVVRDNLTKLCPDSNKKDFFMNKKVHIHFPEGSIKKDGPSAGITLVCALFSLATNTPIAENLVMTGEITLLGKVLKIGGVHQKLMTASREKMSDVILPEENRSDVSEIAGEIKENLRIHYVGNAEEVLRIAFKGTLFK